MASGWNVWVWLAGGGCWWNLWLWLVGVVVRRYIDFLILRISTPLHDLYLFFYKHTYGRLRASHGSHMKGCTQCFIHEEAHTNERFKFCDGHQLYERGVDLEVEGVRNIEMHRGPAAYVLGPPPSRGRDLELEGGVNACDVEYVYETRDSHVRGTE